jgi:hypothetical protein
LARDKRGPLLLASVTGSELVHLLEKALEAGGMMDDQEGRVVAARVVKAMDRFARHEGEGAGCSDVSLVADAKHHFTFEDVEKLIASAMIVGPAPTAPGGTRPSQTVQSPPVSASDALTVTSARRFARHKPTALPSGSSARLAQNVSTGC